MALNQMELETKKKGGLRTLPFIFGNDFCERLATGGFGANFMNYLRGQLHLPITKASIILSTFIGTGSFMTLLGAFVADAYAGKFWTAAVGSIIYLMGMIGITLSAIIPKLRPPPCEVGQVCKAPNTFQMGILYTSFALVALGSGGIRPCMGPFGADQVAKTQSKKEGKSLNFFNWYYFFGGIAMLLAITLIVYIQESFGWGWGFGVPSVLMGISIISFVLGYPFYLTENPTGSPCTRLLQVLVAAYRKRNLSSVTNVIPYENEDLDASISSYGQLVHTDNLRFLDKATIKTAEDNPRFPNLWSLSTVHRVEELKSIIRMGPIWAAGIIVTTASLQLGTLCILQGKTMDRHLTQSFQIPAASLQVFSIIPMLSTIIIYDRILVPIFRRFTGLERGITFLTRMGIGLVISVLATLVAGVVEIKRKNVAIANGLMEHPDTIIPISVFWLVPQYFLSGVAESFMSIGHLEFFYDQSPESMRSTAMALFWVATAIGSYTSGILVSLVHKCTAGENGSNWLQDENLNKGKLEYFFFLLTALQVVNLVYYITCAKFYTFKKLEVKTREDEPVSEETEVELVV